MLNCWLDKLPKYNFPSLFNVLKNASNLSCKWYQSWSNHHIVFGNFATRKPRTSYAGLTSIKKTCDWKVDVHFRFISVSNVWLTNYHPVLIERLISTADLIVFAMSDWPIMIRFNATFPKFISKSSFNNLNYCQ